MSLGGFGAGFAQTFDGAKFGRALNEGIADYREGKAIEAAEKKKAEAIKKLDTEKALQNSQAEAIKNPSAGQTEPQAIPVQGAQSDLDVDVVSSAAINPADAQRSQPMRQSTYDARMAQINDDFDNAKAQARADYYRFRGMTKEQEEAEKKLADMKFAQQFSGLHRNALNGDPEAMGQLVGYMNASMGNGMQIKMGDGGKMSLLQNGKVIQADFVPTRAQIDQAAMGMYNTAKFFKGGDLDSYLNRFSALQKTALAERADNRADRVAAESQRHNIAGEELTARGQDVTMRGQDINADVAREGHAVTMRGQDVTMRGQDISAETARQAQAITARGQDISAATAHRGQDVTMRGQDVSAETARQAQAITARGQDIGAETARRGQDIGAATARRGQDISAETARQAQAITARGQDIGAETARRGQDISAATARRGQDVTMRGQDVSAETARQAQAITARGQDIGAETARRGQDISAATARRGQDIAMRGQDIQVSEGAKNRAQKDRLADLDREVKRLEIELTHADRSRGLDISQAEFDLKREKYVDAKKALAAETAKQNELKYVTSETTGEDELRDPVSNTFYGYMDKSSGELILAGHTPKEVARVASQAERIGASLVTDYVTSPITGRKMPRYAFKVGNKMCDTLEEAAELAGVPPKGKKR